MLSAPLIHGVFRGSPRGRIVLAYTVLSDALALPDYTKMIDNG